MPATEQIWRPLPTMHRIFAWSAVILLAATFLMMAKDESRDWRSYQTKADQLKIEPIARVRRTIFPAMVACSKAKRSPPLARNFENTIADKLK